MYRYYQEINLSEHMLFAKEIGKIYGISEKMVTKLINDYCNENKIIIPKIYYKTKYGLCRVYPQNIYDNIVVKNKT